jgi:cell division protein FtsI (penicillin-binding protein 3)
MAAFALLFAAIGGRLVQLGLAGNERPAYAFRGVANARPQILDRNGALLATDLPSASVYAEPRYVPDVDETVEKLVAIFPDLDARQLHQRLKSDAAFAWLKRQVTPAQKQALWNAGLPAIGLRPEKRRIYPNGPLAAHVLGAVDLDNIGISGIEKWIDGQGLQELNLAGMAGDARKLEPVALTIDVRVQHALADETLKAMARFKAKAGAGLLLDVDNGEVLALASFPDFDPNVPIDALKPERLNRISAGAFEMGSTFKALTTAMALDSGQFTLKSVIDARKPLQFGRQMIHDYRGKYRMLTIPEVFIYSSNISTARIAMTLGGEAQRAYLTRFGLMSRLRTELPESAAPILPAKLERCDDGNRLVRSWHCGDAIAGKHGHRSAGQWRPPDHPDLHQGRPGRRPRRRLGARLACHGGRHALPAALQRRGRFRQERSRRRLSRRWQDGHGGEGRQRPIRRGPGDDLVHGRGSGRQAEIPFADDPG